MGKDGLVDVLVEYKVSGLLAGISANFQHGKEKN